MTEQGMRSLPDLIANCFFAQISEKEKTFSDYVERFKVKDWIISSDYFTDKDKARPNHVFAFTVLPVVAPIEEILGEIGSRLPRDIKHNNFPTESELRFLRSQDFFHFCFFASRNRNKERTLEKARKSLDESLAMMRQWRDVDQQGATILAMEAFRREANKGNFNHNILYDMVLASSFAAAIACLIAKFGSPERISWFSDRDKITTSYNGKKYKPVVHSMYAINLSSFCQQQNIPWRTVSAPFGVQAPDEHGLWYDPLIRLPDYIAGAAAMINLELKNQKNNECSELKLKHQRVWKGIFSDNQNIMFFGVTAIPEEISMCSYEFSAAPFDAA